MKTRLLLVLFVLVTQLGFSQIFSEDFQGLGGALPAGWTVINSDGLTPDANVAQFTDAWIIAADFDNTTDTVAMSTSWYSPAGTSDDWLITPQMALTTNNILTWEEEGQDANFPDGYEVRISTTTPTTVGFLANPALLTVTASSGAVWLTQTVDLDAAGYSNQSVYLAWRNTSTDQFILMIDDIVVAEQVAFDVVMTDTTSLEYTIVPIDQVTPLGTDGVIVNNGGGAVTNANMTVNVYDGLMANVYTGTSNTIPSLAIGASSAVTATGFTPLVPDFYTVELISNITELDGDLTNDTIYSTILVTDSIYARDDATIVGTLGIGAGNGGVIGQQYTVVNSDDLTTVSFYLNNSLNQILDNKIVATIYDMVGGVPNVVIAQTDTLTVTNGVDSLYTMPIMGGPITLAPGDYMVGINEGDSTLSLAYTNAIVTPGTTWITWPTSPNLPWANSEAFGFNVSYIIRPNFGVTVCVPTASTDIVSSCTDYFWAIDGQTYNTTGIYTAVILNAAGCDSTITLDLTIGTLDETTLVVGSTITANQVGATYQWLDCDNGSLPIAGETNQSFTPVVSGNYAVAIVDGVCSGVSACSPVCVPTASNTSETTCISYDWALDGNTYTTSGQYVAVLTNTAGCDSTVTLDLTINTVDVTTAVAGNTITATLTGGTYTWIDCATNSAIANETNQSFTPTVAGNYAVIVSDGTCSDTSACVTSVVGLNENDLSKGIEIFPNPSNGSFTIALSGIVADDVTVVITETSGRVVMTQELTSVSESMELPIDLNTVEAGVYFVIISANDLKSTQRVVVTK